MNRSIKKFARILSAVVAFVGVMLSGASDVWAQQLAGNWTIVSINDERPDGTKVPLYGANPVGLLVFDARGRYSLQICSSGRPKFAANNRNKGTPEEYQAAVKGCNPHWGRYSIDQKDKAIVFKIDHALYTNWEGTEQKRKFTLTGDELKYSVPNPATEAANPVVTWKRVK